jgi:hypothetical protein
MSTSSVAREVREAFASEVLPAGQPVATHPFDDEGARATFEGRRWQEVSVHELAYVTACLRFLAPPAVRVYLPAFLLAALEDPCSAIADCTVEFLKPPKGNPLRPSYYMWWSLFSRQQRAAVVAFLRAMPESVHGENSEAVQALEASANAI